jgi:hypothetical protein
MSLGKRLLKPRPMAVVALVLLALTLSVFVAYVACESSNADCESERHKRQSGQSSTRTPEVALSPIFLAGTKPPDAEEQAGSATAHATPPCPLACKVVVRTFDAPVALFTVLLVFLVSLQSIWMARQESVLQDSVDVANKAADAALTQAEALKLSERAYVKMSHDPPGVEFHVTSEGQSWLTVGLSVKNWGKTPARVVKAVICYRCTPGIETLPEKPVYDENAVHGQVQSFLVTNDFAGYTYERLIPRQQVNEVKEGRSNLWVYGHVEYLDIFDELHVAGYGAFYVPEYDEPAHYGPGRFEKRSNLVFITEPTYNYDRKKQSADSAGW